MKINKLEDFKMKSTGIVRRIDDLGRIMVPKEIRRTLRIKDGDPLEIFVEDGCIVYKKYSPMSELVGFSQTYADSLAKTTGNACIITDRDVIVAVAGTTKKEFLSKPISPELEHTIESRERFVTNSTPNNIINGQTIIFNSMVIYPIISEGEIIGSVILAENRTGIAFGKTEEKLIENAAIFLGKQMEI
jgi:AbrB family transcriptional regulator (stage V sporulation protein T)